MFGKIKRYDVATNIYCYAQRLGMENVDRRENIFSSFFPYNSVSNAHGL